MRVELGGRQQFDFESTLVCNEWLGPDLPKTWEILRGLFEQEANNEQVQKLIAHRQNQALAFLFHANDQELELERLVVVGVTQKGYAASPLMVFEKEKEDAANQQVFAYTVSTQYCFLTNPSEDWKPWVPLVKKESTGRSLINNHALVDFEYLASGECLGSANLKKFAKEADWEKRLQLFERWGLQISFSVDGLDEIGYPFSLQAEETALSHQELKRISDAIHFNS